MDADGSAGFEADKTHRLARDLGPSWAKEPISLAENLISFLLQRWRRRRDEKWHLGMALLVHTTRHGL
jgi:hypothetical protein